MLRPARHILTLALGLLLVALFALFAPHPVLSPSPPAPPPNPYPAASPLPTASPTLAPSLRGSLASVVESQLLGYPGEVGLAITDLQTGETIAINGEKRISSASTIKIFILLAVLREVEAGAYPLAEVEDALEAMMSWSDNQAAATLTTLVGFDKVNRLMKSLGMERSVFHSWPGVEGEYAPEEADNYLTALEVNLALAQLYRGKVLTPAYTRLALELMEMSISEHNVIIPGRLPEGTRVAHKMGWLYWDPELQIEIANDAGVVFVGEGDAPAFAIAFLSQNNPDHDQALALGATLSRLAYNYFAWRYGGS